MANLCTTRYVTPDHRGYYDRQGFHNPGLITDDLVEYIFTCAHQPNSRYPAAAALSNYLTMDVHEAFSRLQVPAVIVFGAKAR